MLDRVVGGGQRFTWSPPGSISFTTNSIVLFVS